MKVAFFFQNTTSWIENGHLEYVKYDSCLQRKIFLKKKKRQLLERIFSLKKRKRDLFSFSFHLKENSSLPFFCVANRRSSSYQRSFFLFLETFCRCRHKTYNSISGLSSQPSSKSNCHRFSPSQRIQLHRSHFNDERILQIAKVNNFYFPNFDIEL